jgi:protein SCO1/2|tara:strand:+ start:906 stop:1511 length:606 start_codon:yes stop_codon:yes gene_type:complete
MRRIIYLIVSVIAFATLAVGVFLTSDHFAYKWESERLLKATLKDTSGNPWQLSQLKDKIGIVYFGYTFCPDVCPTSLNDLSIALDSMGRGRAKYKPIFISVDPARDTPQVIKEYTAHFDKDILGLTGSRAELKSFSFNFGSTYSLQKKGPADQDYVVNHTAGFFMVTSTGQKLPVPKRDNPDDLQKVIIKVKNRLQKNSVR